MNQPRQWWLNVYESVITGLEENEAPLSAWSAYNRKRFDDDIHVVEYSALDLERQRSQKLIDAMTKAQTTLCDDVGEAEDLIYIALERLQKAIEEYEK